MKVIIPRTAKAHTVNQIIVILLDLVAVSILAFPLYFSRHRRRDLVVAYIGVNVGVLAVASVLSSSVISFGLGMGLFGVLSIIRLRSYEIDQKEIAYYFASLSLGLLAGLTPELNVLTVSLMALILVVMFFADSPRLFARYRQSTITANGAFTNETELRAHLTEMLGATIHRVTIKRTDFVANRTVVDVRYELPAATQINSL
jgi:hypothetical protein